VLAAGDDKTGHRSEVAEPTDSQASRQLLTQLDPPGSHAPGMASRTTCCGSTWAPSRSSSTRQDRSRSVWSSSTASLRLICMEGQGLLQPRGRPSRAAGPRPPAVRRPAARPGGRRGHRRPRVQVAVAVEGAAHRGVPGSGGDLLGLAPVAIHSATAGRHRPARQQEKGSRSRWWPRSWAEPALGDGEGDQGDAEPEPVTPAQPSSFFWRSGTPACEVRPSRRRPAPPSREVARGHGRHGGAPSRRTRSLW
jgi:hypothetical protein